MSTRSGPSPTTNTPAVRNTVGRGKEKSQENLNEPTSDAALKEFCDKNYNQLLPILAEKMHQEKVRRDVRKRLEPKDACSMSRSPEPRRDRSRSPIIRVPARETPIHITASTETPKAIIRVPAREEQSPLLRGIMTEKHTHVRGGRMSESEDSVGGHWKSKSKKQMLSMEDEDLSQP
ncbi:hypothetical protein Tco_1486700 [Tanacetum coccineum]